MSGTQNLLKKAISKEKTKGKPLEESVKKGKKVTIQFESDEEEKKEEVVPKVEEIVKDNKPLKKKKKDKTKTNENLNENENQEMELEEVPIAKNKNHKKEETPKYNSLAICFPDSIIALHQSSELRSYFLSEIARMASIFSVNEIIILKDHSYKNKSPNFDSTHYLAINLQYLECPQYLRKSLFPIHPDLKNAGLMNPIESKHHLKTDEYHQYREGVVLNRPVKETAEGSWVDIGLKKQAKINYVLQPNTRVTVKLNETSLETPQKNFNGVVVSQSEPQKLTNTYWGYSVRIAKSIRDVFKKCPFEQGYDVRVYVGGEKMDCVMPPRFDFSTKDLKTTSNVLIVFGGFDGLETILEGEELSKVKKDKLFDNFTNSYSFNIEDFGVKRLRLEEEIFMFLNSLNSK